MGDTDSPLSRIQAAVARLEQPAICPNCRSRWFQEVTFHKYSASAYGSVELWPTETMPQSIRVCLCGRPCKPSPQVRAGRTPNQEIQSFLESLNLATEHPHAGSAVADLQEKLRQVVEQVATTAEVHLLNIAINSLRDEVHGAIASLRDQIQELKGRCGSAWG